MPAIANAILPCDTLLPGCAHHPATFHLLLCSVAFTHNLHAARLTRTALPLHIAPAPSAQPSPSASASPVPACMPSATAAPVRSPVPCLTPSPGPPYPPTITSPTLRRLAVCICALGLLQHALLCSLRSPISHVPCNLRATPACSLIEPGSVSDAPFARSLALLLRRPHQSRHST